MKRIMWEGEEWELIPWEELKDVVGTEVLIYRDNPENTICAGVRICIKWDGEYLFYDRKIHTHEHCNFGRGMWNDPDRWYLPYRKVNTDPNAPSYCCCNGPVVDRRCFDTFKIEKVCVRCRKRKRNNNA